MDVSVIIPNHNYQRYLPECLSSVYASDLGASRLEVILVDDASTDLSVATARDLAFHLGREIRIIRHETNLGLVKTRNSGIREASGEFLFFLDSDNRISPDCLTKHLEVMSSDPRIDACYAPIRDFMSETGELAETRSAAAYDYGKLLKGNYIDGMAMFRADVFRRMGGYDTEMPLKGWEDYEYWLRLGARGCRVEFLEGPPLSYYRLHDGSMTQKVTRFNLHLLWKYLHGLYDLDFMIDEEGRTH